MQAVRIAGVLCDWRRPNGGIPQGTKLGVILFSVVTNELLTEWRPRTKFVDDTTALEIIPRNSTSLTNIVADNVNDFAESDYMKLNPKKCKEMVIDPLEYNTTALRPITKRNTTIETIKKYKLLGVILTDDIKCSGGARPQNLGGAFEGQTHILGGQDRIFKKVLLFAHAVVTGLSPPPPPPQEIRPLSKGGQYS
jgi:hypothetical protein